MQQATKYSGFGTRPILSSTLHKGDSVNQRIIPACTRWILVVALLVLLPTLVKAQFTFITNNGTLAITKYTGLGGAVEIPSVTNGLTITSIGSNAFMYCNTLTKVSIPSSVTEIGSQAFCLCPRLTNVILGSSISNIGWRAFSGCFALPSVTIPDSVATFGDEAFGSCSGLTNINLGTNITNIGSNAFVTCSSLISVTIPNSVRSIGPRAFYQCTHLSSATIGENVTSIGDQAFYGSFLTNITIPNSVTNIANSAFANCGNLKAMTVGVLNPVYSSADGVLFNKNQTTLIQYPRNKGGTYTIPVTVSSIESNGFYNCLNLFQVTVPESVTNIGNRAFGMCGYLTAITVGTANPVYSSVDGVLFNKDRTVLIQYPGGKAGNYTVPDTVTTISLESFYNCRLTQLTTGDSVTNIADWACSYCSSLASLTIGKSITSIGAYAFFNSGLTNLTIPGNVASIGTNAFASCYSLTGVFFDGDAPSGDSSVFQNVSATVHYLPGTAGWGPTFGGLPTKPWVLPNPVILHSIPGLGVQAKKFGFTISWATNLPVVVETCTSMANSDWSPVSTNTLTGGTSYFNDPAWTNYPQRFYRVRAQ